MSFLAPAVLFAGFALAAPILIHLLNRSRPRPIRWAAMTLLRQSEQVNRSRLRTQDLLLLLLRCLLIALIVLAFARPALRQPLTDAPAGQGILALIIDHSASMGQSDGLQTRFDQAKAAATQLVQNMDANSKIALFLASDQVQPLLPQPSADKALLRRSIDRATLSSRSSNLLPAIQAAYDALRPFPGQNREIHILTDNQQLAWQSLDEIKKLAAADPSIRLIPTTFSPRGEDNIAITAIEPEPGLLSAGEPLRFTIQLHNHGSQPVSNLRLTLALNNNPPSDETLLDTIPPGAPASAQLLVRLPTAGFHSVRAALPPDRFPIDNERTFALQVLDRLEALVVQHPPNPATSTPDAFFLLHALTPFPPEQSARQPLRITTITHDALASKNLPTYDLIFLLDPPTPSSSLASSLLTYVENGGSLVIFPGPRTRPADWEKNPTLLKLLPARILPLQKQEIAWPAAQLDHPITSIWNDPAQGSLAAIRWSQFFPLQLPTTPTPHKPRTIVRSTDGTPSIVESSLGRGTVTLFPGLPTPAWTTLPLHPLFVPLTQRLAGYLTRGREPPLNLLPGQQFQSPAPPETLGREFFVTKPGATSRRPAGRVEAVNASPTIRYRETDLPGPYLLHLDDSSQPAAIFSINLDPGESNLRQIDPALLSPLTQPPTSTSPPNNSGATPAFKITAEYWGLLFLLAFLVLLTEQTLAHLWSRPR